MKTYRGSRLFGWLLPNGQDIFKSLENTLHMELFTVEGQEHGPIDSRYFSDFFVLSVQVLVPSQGQELVPIAVKDKNMSRLPIR